MRIERERTEGPIAPLEASATQAFQLAVAELALQLKTENKGISSQTESLGYDDLISLVFPKETATLTNQAAVQNIIAKNRERFNTGISKNYHL